MGARMGEHAFIVDYELRESQILGHSFQLEGVRFTPRGSQDDLATLKTSLIKLDPQVYENDRMLSAAISAGSKFGSKEQMSRSKEREIFLLGQATTFDFASWKANLEPVTTPLLNPEVQANINDLIRHREAEMENTNSEEETPPLGQTRQSDTSPTSFDMVMESPPSGAPPGGLS